MCFRSPKKGQSEQRRGSDAHSMHLRHQKKVKRNDLQYYSVIKPNWYTFTNLINQEMRRWPRITKKRPCFSKVPWFWPLPFSLTDTRSGRTSIFAWVSTMPDRAKIWQSVAHVKPNWNSGFKTIPENIWKPSKNPWKWLKVQIFFKAANQSAPPTTPSAVASFNIGLRWPPWLRGRQWESACQQSFEPWLVGWSLSVLHISKRRYTTNHQLAWCYYTIIIKAFCLYYNKSSLSHPINNFHLAHLRSQLHMHTASCSIAMLSFSQQLLRLLACSG